MPRRPLLNRICGDGANDGDCAARERVDKVVIAVSTTAASIASGSATPGSLPAKRDVVGALDRAAQHGVAQHSQLVGPCLADGWAAGTSGSRDLFAVAVDLWHVHRQVPSAGCWVHGTADRSSVG